MRTFRLKRTRETSRYLSAVSSFLTVLLVSAILYQLVASPRLEETRAPTSRLSAEIRNLQELEPLARIETVRDWVYRNTDVAADESVLLSYDRFPLHVLTLDEMLDLHKQDIGGHFCAGINYILKRVYDSLGYNSWMYNYGDESALTHAVALVEVNGKIYAQDAYFNVSYVNQDGQPLPFYEMLEGLVAGKEPDQKIGPSLWREVHLKDDHLTDDTKWWVAAGVDRDTCTTLSEDRFICHSKTSLKNFIDVHPLDETYTFLSQKGFPRNLHYLALFPIGITGDEWIDDPAKSEILQRIIDIREEAHLRVSMYSIPIQQEHIALIEHEPGGPPTRTYYIAPSLFQ